MHYAAEVHDRNIQTAPSHLKPRCCSIPGLDVYLLKLNSLFSLAIQYVRPRWIFFGHTVSVFVLSSGVLCLSSFRDLEGDGEEKKRVFNEALSA